MNRRIGLITASMPPGVEHADVVAVLRSPEGLITASMPPGVEHLVPAAEAPTTSGV